MKKSSVSSGATLSIDRRLQLPLYLQICERFKTAIAQGHLRAGQRVPAVRALAIELNLARGTVETAYRILSDEGYLLVRGAAGTVVSPSLPVAPRERATTSAPLVASAAATSSPSSSSSSSSLQSSASPHSDYDGR